MADTSGHDSGHSSNNASRTPSIVGRGRNGQPKGRLNVKFTLGPENNQIAVPSRRNSISESPKDATQTLPESPDTVRPVVALNVVDWSNRTGAAALHAHDRASRHADRVKRNNSVPVSRRTSFDDNSTIAASPMISPIQRPAPVHGVSLDDIPLVSLERVKTGLYDTDDDTEEDDIGTEKREAQRLASNSNREIHLEEARRIVRTFTNDKALLSAGPHIGQHRSGTATPAIDQRSHEYEYVPRPAEYKPSVLSMLLASRLGSTSGPQTVQDARKEQSDYLAAKLAPYQDPSTDPRKQHADFFRRNPETRSPGNLSGTQSPYNYGEASSRSSISGRSTPKQKRPKWYKNEDQSPSTGSMGKLIGNAAFAAMAPSVPESSTAHTRPPLQRNGSSSLFGSAVNLIKHPVSHLRNGSSPGSAPTPDPFDNSAERIADRLASQQYLLHMCRALMRYGAPTHRLEEYMQMAARKLAVRANFQYLPSCMIVSFDDPVIHTTELHLVKEGPAVDLGKLKDIQEVYKDVIHDKYSIGEAMDDIQEIWMRPKKFSSLVLVPMYGIAAIAVGPFAFGSRPVDFPIAFLLGTTLGSLQLGLASRSTQFSHIFEVVGTLITSFAARGFGSINHNGAPLFCFSALAQSSIALILPGWIILSAALELQSRNIIAGSIRMVYAIIYTLFLGFGILIGVTIMGLIYPGATDDLTCRAPEYWTATDSSQWKLLYTKFIWVPIFTVCLAMINQAKWKQMPWMIAISAAGYQVNYWSGIRFSQNAQIANALGAFCIGSLANLYSRLRHGVAAAAMLPAIFVMVPSGLAASGSLVAGLTSANQITHNATGISIINNGTQGFYDAQSGTGSNSGSSVYGGTIFNVGYGMVQVAIGISVGLFLSALVVYPFGKKRSGLFTL